MTTKIGEKDLNINLDSDGILSYLFLKIGGLKNGIGGYNNSSDIILSTKNDVDTMWSDSFVDIFTPKENTLSIDQHIIFDKPMRFGENKFNPHIQIEEHHANDIKSYTGKYPFSTCMFILAYLEKNKLITWNIGLLKNIRKTNTLLPPSINLCDLILRADGVLLNFKKYRKNVEYWNDKLIEYSENGTNIKTILEYALNLTQEECEEKHNIISNFYKNYGLKDDGGYNKKLPIVDNLILINALMKSFALNLEVDLNKKKIDLYVFRANTNVIKVKDNIDLYSLDTYSFVGNNKLSYSKDFKFDGKIKNIEIFE